MPITFERKFIISQLGLALSAKNGMTDDAVQRAIDSAKNARTKTIETRTNFINGLSKVNYKGKPEDVRRAVAEVYRQYGHVNLDSDLPTDEQIEAIAIRDYGGQRVDRQKEIFKRAVEILTASNTANLSFQDLKNLQITGIESFAVKAIESGTDADGITPHTEDD